jgi:hypothetical protein
MSETAGAVVRDALSELTIQPDEQTVQPVELFTGIRFLNRMMAAYDSQGIKLGYTFVNGPNDILTVPAGVIEGMVFNLAVRLATGYDMPVSPSLAKNAVDGMRVMRNVGLKLTKVAFPSTLPIGSGNEEVAGSYNGENFYPDCCEDENPCSSTTSNGDSNGL